MKYDELVVEQLLAQKRTAAGVRTEDLDEAVRLLMLRSSTTRPSAIAGHLGVNTSRVAAALRRLDDVEQRRRRRALLPG